MVADLAGSIRSARLPQALSCWNRPREEDIDPPGPVMSPKVTLTRSDSTSAVSTPISAPWYPSPSPSATLMIAVALAFCSAVTPGAVPDADPAGVGAPQPAFTGWAAVLAAFPAREDCSLPSSSLMTASVGAASYSWIPVSMAATLPWRWSFAEQFGVSALPGGFQLRRGDVIDPREWRDQLIGYPLVAVLDVGDPVDGEDSLGPGVGAHCGGDFPMEHPLDDPEFRHPVLFRRQDE